MEVWVVGLSKQERRNNIDVREKSQTPQKAPTMFPRETHLGIKVCLLPTVCPRDVLLMSQVKLLKKTEECSQERYRVIAKHNLVGSAEVRLKVQVVELRKR